MRRLMTSYAVYANGRLIGQYGDLPPHPRAFSGDRMQLFAIPSDVLVPGQPLQIAIRVSALAALVCPAARPIAAPSLGAIRTLRSHQVPPRSKPRSGFSSRKTFFCSSFSITGHRHVPALFALQRSDHEYLWFGAFELVSAAGFAAAAYGNFYAHPLNLLRHLQTCLETAESAFPPRLSSSRFSRQRRGALYWLAIASPHAPPPCFSGSPVSLEWLSIPVWNTLLAIGQIPYVLVVLVLLAIGARGGNRYAKLLLLPISLYYAAFGLSTAFFVYESAGHPGFQEHTVRWFFELSSWPFPFSVTDATDALVQLAVFTILVLRFARTRQFGRRLATELEAARAVQQSHPSPNKFPPSPASRFQCVYTPAGEVGGDFFQILHLPDGSALVAIGDVSGKGLPAAHHRFRCW